MTEADWKEVRRAIRERVTRRKLEDLRRDVQQGFEQIERGEYTEYGSGKEVADRIIAEGLKAYSETPADGGMKRLRIALEADVDVLEIWTYYFERSPQAAERLVRQITSEYDTLLECVNTELITLWHRRVKLYETSSVLLASTISWVGR